MPTCTSLQQHLDQERAQYNQLFPSRAGDCGGRPPLVAHPELLKPHRLYRPEAELSLFSLQRVADYFYNVTWVHLPNCETKCSRLGGQR
jgi:hypothetical protein